MRTEIEAVAVTKMGDGAAAEDPAALENRHGTAGASQVDGCRQPRHPAADDHDSLCHRKAKELRIAAFGLVDDVPQFEIAQVYLTIAAQKLGHEPDARHAAQRVLAAERLEQHYALLSLPADIRASFEKIVSQILTSDQVAVLHARPVAPVSVPVPTPQPQSPAPIVAQPVAPIVAPPPAPAPRSPAPIKPQPVAPIDPGKPIVSHESPKTPIELPPAAPRAEVEPPSV